MCIRLVLCFRSSRSEHQILLPAAVPQGSPNRGTNNRLHCHHFSSLPEFLVLGMCRKQGQSVLEMQRLPCVPPHTACPALDLGALRALPLARSGGSCCARKWSGWESCSYPEIRSITGNGSPKLLTRPCQRNPVSE